MLKKFIAKIVAIGLLTALLAVAAVRAQDADTKDGASDKLQKTGEQAVDAGINKGRDSAGCAAGLTRFLSPVGSVFSDAADYWRDFSLLPSHYADVMNVENQMNKARYAAIAVFSRCDLKKIQSSVDTFYKLAAELYFVRHYVDESGGYLHMLLKNPDEERDLLDKMIGHISDMDPNLTEEGKRAVFEGYFAEFKTKYKDRAERYAKNGDDPATNDLTAKFAELLETLGGFRKMGSEISSLGEDVANEASAAAGSVAKSAKNLWNSPGKAIKEAALDTLNRFVACPQADNAVDCANSAKDKAKDALNDVFGSKSGIKKPGRTYEDIMNAIDNAEAESKELEEESDIMARYELLYGQVNGDGVSALASRLDKLNAILGQGRGKDDNSRDPLKAKPVPGSLGPMKKVDRCAAIVLGNECK
ncbi:hypothetical protein HZA42_05860 [Candidatus Peregrinibacteria bacterium]|nr:hypothetical protein [Candidatus Peregrinibacteria bacterium]